MHRSLRGRLVGIAYVAPALIFVLAFTAYPLGQMVWMSFHNWSLITPPRYVGLANYERAFDDKQFWVSFLFTLKYTALLTPVLMIGGYALALLTSENSPLRRFTRTVVFIPVVIGLGVSSLLWYWLFSTDFGLVNRILLDLGLISKPVLWLGVDADTSNFAISASVVWKVIGFGMILFVGAIQAIPTEITEATLVDGASYWQRVSRVHSAADASDRSAGHVGECHRLAAGIRPVLHHDGRATSERDRDLGLLRVSELVPVPEARLRRRSVIDPGGDDPGLHGRADAPHPPEPRMSVALLLLRNRTVAVRQRVGRTGYLIGAICIAISTVMLLPLVFSVFASVKPTAEAAAVPPTYYPHGLSLESYQRLWTYQEGLPTYLVEQPRHGVADDHPHAAAHRAGGLCAWRGSRSPARKWSSSSCCWRSSCRTRPC